MLIREVIFLFFKSKNDLHRQTVVLLNNNLSDIGLFIWECFITLFRQLVMLLSSLFFCAFYMAVVSSSMLLVLDFSTT